MGLAAVLLLLALDVTTGAIARVRRICIGDFAMMSMQWLGDDDDEK